MATEAGRSSRAMIALSVLGLIAEHGIDAVTIRRVATHAGVSAGRVQHHFGTRDDLLLAGAEAMIHGAHAAYERGAADPAQRLRAAVGHVIPDTPAARAGSTVWLAYVAQSVRDARIAAVLAGAKRGQEDEVAALVAELNGLPYPTALAGARRLIAVADGLAQRVLVGDLTPTQAHALLEEEVAALAPPHSAGRGGAG